jgi:hypothetical protein
MAHEQQLFPNKLRYQHIGIAVLIVLVGFMLRAGVVYQRAGADTSFIPPVGTDQATHLEQARGLLAGTWPDTPFLFQPAPPYVYAVFMLLFGDSVPMIALSIALLNALACGWLIGSAWLLTKQAWGGYLAGGIYAISSTGVFYGASLVIAPQAVFWMALLIFLVLWQRKKMTWSRTIALGIVGAIMSLTRVNLLPVMGLVALWYLVQPISWRERILQLIVLTLVTVAVVGQVTWHNYRTSGDFIFLVQIGSKELYWANNRDSAGRNTQTPAVKNVDMLYDDAIKRDIALDPLRFIGLIGYKFARFWNWQEEANNISFERVKEASSLLRLLPLNFSFLLVGGTIGLWLLWKHDRYASSFLILLLLWMLTTFLMVFVYGRLRHPAEIPLILALAYGAVIIVDSIQHSPIKQVGRQIAVPTVVSISLVLFSAWVLFPTPKLPPKRSYTALPADLIELNIRFEDLILRGWRPLDIWPASRDGWVQVFESYGIELFWQMTEPSDTEYLFFLAYVDGDTRYDAVDMPIGAISFPFYTTTSWDTETIYSEILNLRLDDDVPQERSGQIRLGVWYWDKEGLIVNVPADNGEANILIQSVAVFNSQLPPKAPDLPASDFVFGDLIALRAYELSEKAVANETITISFYWEALQNIDSNYTALLHVQDENGAVVAQGDNLPIQGLFTSNWTPNYPLPGQLPLTMPEEAGTYEIYVGLYNEAGRLATGTADNRVLLGIITVE